MKPLIACLVLALVTVVLAACGAKPAATVSAVPTNTTIPIYNYNQPTEPPAFASLAATEAAEASAEANSTPAAVALDPELVSRGRDRYVALACGSCHGDAGQGTDKGSALVPLKVDEDGFDKFLQTGGGLGNSHLFAGNKLSPTGAHNLYLYVLSLAQGGGTPEATAAS